jgi:nucleotide sugar dehydrogenase
MTTQNITVIGIGKLGLGFALLLEKAGYNVLGVDVNSSYVDNLNSRDFVASEPGYNELIQNYTQFRATTSLQEGVEHSDIIFIIVQTPNSGGDRFYDHSILSNVLVNINKLKPKNKEIIIGCTVMPKYIDEIGKYLIANCYNSFLSYNPEFVAQGDIIKGFERPDIILVGTESPCLENILTPIYTKMVLNTPKFCYMKPVEAEIVKIGLNSFITTKISFANMVSDLCDKIGADKHIVLDSIGSDSRIGNKYFRPGYSYGGPCFPRDTMAFEKVLNSHYLNSDLLRATTSYNKSHIFYDTLKLMETNKDHYRFENVCYKENSTIPLIEESAKLKIAKELVKRGKAVTIVGNEDIITEVRKEYGGLFDYEIAD